MIVLTIMFEPRGLWGLWLRMEAGIARLKRGVALDDPAEGTG